MLKTPAQRRKAIIFISLVLSLWASWYVSQEPVPEPSLLNERSASRQSARKASNIPATPIPATLEWPQPSSPRGAIVDVFSAPQAVAIKPVLSPQVTVTPPPPQFNYKYIGRLEGGYNSAVFLSDDPNRVITAKAGQNLNDGWQLVSVDAQRLVFRHLPTGNENTMTIGSF